MGHNERGKFIALSAFIKKLERSHSNNLTQSMKQRLGSWENQQDR